MNYKKIYNHVDTNGFYTIDNFLPNKIANNLNQKFIECQNWDEISQIRPNHYKEVMKFDRAFYPSSDEIFYSKFSRSYFLENQINKVFLKYLKPVVNNIYKLQSHEIRCHKMDTSCLYRFHIDDYTSKISTTYYLNKSWVWDWGGILHLEDLNNLENIHSILPKYNRLVIMKQPLNHFVTPVNDFALEPRYTIVTFNE